MKKRVFRILAVAAALFSAALPASALEDIPVYGPARVAVEDEDLLKHTVLEVGVLAVTPDRPYRVVIGDGITPGGVEIHPEGCVTQFNQIANATTNLNMNHYSITFGPWAMSGGMDEWAMTWGGSETWLRLVRDTGLAYFSYDFEIIDAMHYRFGLVWTGEGYDFPVLQVSTNLLEGFATASGDDVTYSRPDVSHLVVDYSVPGDYEFLAFRFFAPSRMKTGAYFSVPVHADYGLSAVGSLCVTGRVESYYDEHAEENRDRYVPGSITIDGEEVATTGAVAAVAADLAAHQAATNPHGITAAGIGALTAETDSAALSALGVASNALREAIAGHAADTNNPHRTTPDGIGMVEWLRARGLVFGLVPLSEGMSIIQGFGHYLGLEENLWELPGDMGSDFAMTSTNKTWNFQTPEPPKWKGVGLATTNALAASISNLAVSASNSVSNVNARVDALSSVVGTIDADYVTSSDIADFATTQAVASVERRTSALEAASEEYWCSWSLSLLSTTKTNWISTNWPARKVNCYLSVYGTNLIQIAMPDWAPEEPCELHLYVKKSSTNTSLRIFGPQKEQIVWVNANMQRIVDFCYHPNTGWICEAHNLATLFGPSYTTPPDNAFLPTTNNPVATMLSMSPAPSLLPNDVAPPEFDQAE